MILKTISPVFLFLLIANTLSGQELKPTRLHQFGINFSSLNSFGIHYKTGSNKTLLRLSLLTANMSFDQTYGRTQDSVDTRNSNLGAGFRIGFEKKIPVYREFSLLWGVEAGCNYSFNKSNYNGVEPSSEYSQWGIQPGVYAIFGGAYTLKEHIVFGVEITPGVWYSIAKSTNPNRETTSHQLGVGLNTGSASLSVAYRFGK